MGTKNEPGEFDCHAKAEPDEPRFTLLARDPLAPHLVRLWAAARRGDLYGGLTLLSDLFMAQGFPLVDEAKESEADTCADEMGDWRDEHNGN